MTSTLAPFKRPTLRDKLEKSVGRVKSVTELLSDIGGMLGKVDENHKIGDVLAKVVPWAADFAKDVGVAATDAFPIVNFAIKLLGKRWKQTDPHVLAYLACTLAYESSVQQALEEVGQPKGDVRVDQIQREMRDAHKALDDVSFHDFSLESAAQHAFATQSDEFFGIFAKSAGYGDVEERRLLASIRGSFVQNLKSLLSNGATKERFAPVETLLRLNTTERQAYDALDLHADYQEWLYSGAPLRTGEGFAHAHLCVDMDCGLLTPLFEETSSPREPALKTILELLGNPYFEEAIVIQGAAGSGKSALTLRLCAELIKEGLRPIRVQLRDLRFDISLDLAIPAAVRLGPPRSDPLRPRDLFLNGRIFDQRVQFREASICPFVLILDGWDELRVSVQDGFEKRLERLLEHIRNQYLRGEHGHSVRVVITGRPTPALDRTKFLRDTTSILTLRPLSPVQVRELVGKMVKALRDRPLESGAVPDTAILDPAHFETVITQYARDFDLARNREEREASERKNEEARESDSGELRAIFEEGSPMELVGHPLLAQIAVRFMSRWGGGLDALIKTPTALYRHVIDVTCEKGGQVAQEPLDLDNRHRVRGSELRRLLRQTAVAMTAFGVKSISYDELEQRLSLAPEGNDARNVSATKEQVLSAVLLSFYFRGGFAQPGCAFLHESFREYLLAEEIVEILKRYGSDTDPSNGSGAAIPLQKAYWRDFELGDPRRDLSRSLAPVLSSQWMNRNVATHVRELLAWEIDRAVGRAPIQRDGRPTSQLSLDGWERVRDGLADLWDWWAEGVHMRPQPRRERDRMESERSYVDLLVEDAFPKALQRRALRAPRRTIAVDACLGDGLFCLASIVHRHINTVTGWLVRGTSVGDRWAGLVRERSVRPYQSIIKQEDTRWIFFRPTGKERPYFMTFCARINAAGQRRRLPNVAEPFPGGVDLGGLDWGSTSLAGTMVVPNLSHANLEDAELAAMYLWRADMNETYGPNVLVWNSTLDDAKVCRAFLAGATFRDSSCRRASFLDANLERVQFSRCDLRGASFVGANLREAVFDDCLLHDADFDRAEVEGMRVSGGDLTMAKLTAAQWARIHESPRRRGEDELVG